MKKSEIIILSTFILFIMIIVFFLIKFISSNRETIIEDENLLYKIEFDDEILKYRKYDYVFGQNMIVGVEKSTDGGITYTEVTKEGLTVSIESKFIFLNKLLGFIISKENISRKDNFSGLLVTQDGGKTFNNAIFNYDNDRVDIITIDDFPYIEDNILKIKCWIYDLKEDNSGYEDKQIIFISDDNGLTWKNEEQ